MRLACEGFPVLEAALAGLEASTLLYIFCRERASSWHLSAVKAPRPRIVPTGWFPPPRFIDSSYPRVGHVTLTQYFRGPTDMGPQLL